MKKHQIVLTIILVVLTISLVVTLRDEKQADKNADLLSRTTRIVKERKPDSWELEQRAKWIEGLDYTLAAYKIEYDEALETSHILDEILKDRVECTLFQEDLKYDAEVRENYIWMLSELYYSVDAMADWVLIKYHSINPEPMADETVPINEVLKDRILDKAKYKEDGEDFDGEWLYSLSCIPATKQYYQQILREAKQKGEIDESYFNRYYNSPFLGESRGVTELHDFRVILSDYYEWVEEPSISYDEFEVWACCYILYGKDFDFKTVKKIINDKAIAGNVKLKPNTGSPIIL